MRAWRAPSLRTFAGLAATLLGIALALLCVANILFLTKKIIDLLTDAPIEGEFPLGTLEVLGFSIGLILLIWLTVFINTLGCRLLFDKPAGGTRELLTPTGWKKAGLTSGGLGLAVVAISAATGAWPLTAGVLPILALSAGCFWLEKSWYVGIRP